MKPLLLSLALALALTHISQAELLLNGSFEVTTGQLAPDYANDGLSFMQAGDVDNWGFINSEAQNYLMWTKNPEPSGGYNTDYVRVPQDGDKYVCVSVAVYQPVNLTAGTEYTVSFWELNRSTSSGLSAGFYSDAGLTTPVSTLHTANNPNTGDWQQTSFTYTPASSGTVYLGFKSVGGWGANLDNVSVTSASGPAIPASPTGLVANPGSGQVTLSWNAAGGATGYDIKRATVQNGPYDMIASGVANTTYSDSGLNNGTTYYYVVSATNTAGESPNSSEVGATPVANATLNLLLNGGFEVTAGQLAPDYANDGLSLMQAGDVDNWGFINSESYNYLMWTKNPEPSGGYNADYVRVPQDGNKYLCVSVAVYQPVNLTAGTEYTVSFWELNRSTSSGLSAGFYSDAGLTTPVSTLHTANNPNTGDWQQTSFTYTPASSGTVYLGFKSVGGWGANLDNASVTSPSVATPYDTWTTGTFAHNFTDTDPTHDPDLDGLTNFEEFAFGLDPTSGTSSNPITTPLSPTGTFSYKKLATSGLTYSVWVSMDLQNWGTAPAEIIEEPGDIDPVTGAQTVTVELINPPLADTLFIRVKAE